MSKLSSIVIVLILLFSVSLTFAHGKDHHEEKDTLTIVGKDTIAINGVATKKALELKTKEEKEETEPFVLNIGDEIFEHMHNKIVHFPVALIILAFVFTLLNLKYNRFDITIKILLAVAIVFGIAAYFTGLNQAEVFMGGPKEWLVKEHKTFGISTIISSVVWFISLYIEPIKKYAWLIGLIAFVLVSITGFLGGTVAH